MDFAQFQAKWTGKVCDFDGVYGTQCVDLYRYYCQEVLGTPQSPTVAGAKDIWTTYDKTLFDAIPNTPEGVPQAGDIIIWTGGTWGHVAICVDANKDDFHSFDANYPTGSLPHIQFHNYTNVLGWLRKKVDIIMNPLDYKLTPQDWIDLGIQDKPIDHSANVGELLKDLGLRYDIIKDLNAQVSTLQAHNTELQNSTDAIVAEAKKAVSNSLEQNNASQVILTQTKAALATTQTDLENLQAQEKSDKSMISALQAMNRALVTDALTGLTGKQLIILGFKKLFS